MSLATVCLAAARTGKSAHNVAPASQTLWCQDCQCEANSQDHPDHLCTCRQGSSSRGQSKHRRGESRTRASTRSIPTYTGATDAIEVSLQGTALVRELHRWLGSALDPHLSELKPVQVKELSEVFAGEERPLQTRFTRSQQREHARKEAEASLVGDHSDGPVNGSHDAGVEEAGTAAVDVFDYMDPVAILDKLPGDFYTMLQSPKWKERKELALDPLVDLLNKSPRLVEANYDELVRALAGRMADANIVCVILAARSIEQLASGLRASFARYKPIVVPALLERTKEKKQNVVDALTGALDASAANVCCFLGFERIHWLQVQRSLPHTPPRLLRSLSPTSSKTSPLLQNTRTRKSGSRPSNGSTECYATAARRQT